MSAGGGAAPGGERRDWLADTLQPGSGVGLAGGVPRGSGAQLYGAVLIEGQQLRLYPVPALSFDYRDPLLQDTKRCACEYVRRCRPPWPTGSDIRCLLEGLPRPSSCLLDQPLGGTFAAGLHLLLSNPCDLAGYVVCAAVSTAGPLRGPDEPEWQVRAAAIRNAAARIQGVRAAVEPPVSLAPAAPCELQMATSYPCAGRKRSASCPGFGSTWLPGW
jgi:hypothetical protein